MPATIDQVRSAISATEKAVTELGQRMEQPTVVVISGIQFHRYREGHAVLASYLKVVRAVSSLNACLVLLDAGYTIEVQTLCRIIDECNTDVFYLASGPDDTPTPHQQQMVEEFFKEVWTDPIHLLVSPQSRPSVPRKKVQAHIARIPHQQLNPGDTQAMQEVLHHAYSGYVHSAYAHIMGLFDASGGGFLLRGTHGARRIEEAVFSLAAVTYKAMVAAEVVATRCNATSIHAELKAARERFYADADLGIEGDPEKHIKRVNGKSGKR